MMWILLPIFLCVFGCGDSMSYERFPNTDPFPTGNQYAKFPSGDAISVPRAPQYEPFPGSSWSPDSVAGGTWAWYHADDYTQATLPRWGDNSLHGRGLAFPAVGGIPDQGSATAIDGKRAQGFAGNDVIRYVGAATDAPFLYQDGTCFFYVQYSAAADTHVLIDQTGSTAGTRVGLFSQIDGTNQRITIQGFDTGGVLDFSQSSGNGTVLRSTPLVLAIRVTAATNRLDVWCNGTKIINNVAITRPASTTPFLPYALGNFANGADVATDTLFIRAAALYNSALSDADVATVNANFSALVSNRTTQWNLWLLGDSQTETTGWYEKFYAKLVDSLLLRVKGDRIGSVARAGSNGAPAGFWDVTSGWVLSQIQTSVNSTISGGGAASATHVIDFGGLNNVQDAHWVDKATYKSAKGALIDSIRTARPGIPYYILQMPPATAASHPPARIAEAVAADQELASEKSCTWVDLGLVSVTDFQADLLHLNTTTGTDKVANGVATQLGLQ